MKVTMLPGNGAEEQILLSELIALDDAGFEDAVYPLREIDTEHVASLAETSPQELPAIKTVRVNVNGMVRSAVIDGYHRWEAAKVRKDQTIKAVANTYQTENAVIMDAFTANFNHGLKASKETRSDYAVWLYFADTKNKLSMRDIAKEVGLNVSTVSRAIKKAESDTEEREEPNGTSRAEIDASKKLVTALRKFYQEEHTLLGSFVGNSQRDEKHRARAIYNHIASLPKESHPQILQELRSLNETLAMFIALVDKPATAKR